MARCGATYEPVDTAMLGVSDAKRETRTGSCGKQSKSKFCKLPSSCDAHRENLEFSEPAQPC